MSAFNFASIPLVALALTACTGCSSLAQSTPTDTSIRAPRIYQPKLAKDLVDHSGEVQSVQGIDPRKYFVANEIALNAVDADGDGIWDDVMERIKDDPIWDQVDTKLIVQSLIGLQGQLLAKSTKELLNQENMYWKSTGCLYYKYPPIGDTYASFKVIRSFSSKALINSKYRLLAAKYGDFLASGNLLPEIIESDESCK